MAKADTSRIEALDAVLAEKRKHEGFLAKLEERRATTPANVFARLRDEYLTKLTDLQVRASIEAESLTEGLKEDEAAVVDIEARLAAITEERIEGELRAEVGEYDPKEWAERLKALNASVSKTERERDVKVATFERTRALLLEAGAAPAVTDAAPVAPARSPTPQSIAAPVAAPASAPVARPTPLPPPTPVLRPSAAAGATPALSATPIAPAPAVRALTPPAPVRVVAAAPPAAALEAPPVAAPAAPAPAAPMAGSPSFDELAFLNSVVGRPSSQIRAEPPAARASRPVSAQPDGPPSSPFTSPAPPATAPPRATTAKVGDDPDSGPLGRPTPRTSQAIKTLKCAECGTLNFPTEWYCERCGGELAAL